MHAFLKSLFFLFSVVALTWVSLHGAHPSKGLWVGEVALNAVNEATGAVGDSNTYEFSDPEIPTPTSDTAYLRLILHVNGTGQVRLLKSVAIVEAGTRPDGGTNLLLLTDPALYPNFPGIARRVATAFYDFGDPAAVGAVQLLIDTAADVAAARALAGDPQQEIRADVSAALSGVAAQADVDSAYLNRGTGESSFLTDDFFSLEQVHTIADAVAELIHDGEREAADFSYSAGTGTYSPFPSDPIVVGGSFAAVVNAAGELRDASFYGDTRGLEAIVAIVTGAAKAADALDAGESLSVKTAAARLAAEAAWHNAADLNQDYNRFLASDSFAALPTALVNAAVQTAIAAAAAGEEESEIVASVTDALLAETPVQTAYANAEAILSASLWGDPRARRAIDSLIERAATSAASAVLANAEEGAVREAVTEALEAAIEAVEPGAVFAHAPSPGYTRYVTGDDFEEAWNSAADAAASEAFFQYNAGVTDSAALRNLTRRAVSKALTLARNQAAMLPFHSVPLAGELVGGGTLEGSLHLPALAPTNPFMHRFHPDHSEGFPIDRHISLSVDTVSDGGAFGRAGYGVSQLTGTYREEIFGLHKPLGNSQNIGLRTEGTFTLNRISLVDTLNF